MEDVACETAVHEKDAEPEAAKDFEDAIKACGFGLFNVFLLLAALPGLMGSLFEALTMSYVLPSAECDLHLTPMDKGAINAMTFGGAILSAVPWGLLADTWGRRKILIYGLLSLSLVTFCSSFSQTSKQLMIYKFIGGLINSGPGAVFLSYISEFHGNKHRVQILTTVGLLKALPLFLQPVLAYLILPLDIDFRIFGNKFTAWQLFIAITAIPAFLSGLLLMLFPESPKFLMSRGRNQEALEAFRTVYAMNTKNRRETYPVTHLVDETFRGPLELPRLHDFMTAPRCRSCQKRSLLITKFIDGLKQIKVLGSPKYIGLVSVVFSTYFALAFSVVAIRLWMPQYFLTVKEMSHKGDNNSETCHVLNYILDKAHFMKTANEVKEKVCSVHIEPGSFVNNIYSSTGVLVHFALMTIIIKYVGNNFLLRLNMAISCYSLISIYWSQSQTITSILAGIFSATGIVSLTFILNISISSFPTIVRTMAVICLMSFGRLGGMLGNIMLPLFMKMHCAGMFFIHGAFILFSLTFSYFIPNTEKQNLQ